jgi:hypothetical protein
MAKAYDVIIYVIDALVVLMWKKMTVAAQQTRMGGTWRMPMLNSNFNLVCISHHPESFGLSPCKVLRLFR